MTASPKSAPARSPACCQDMHPCKTSKKRCDSRTPCSNCSRRDFEEGCTYDYDTFAQVRNARSTGIVASNARRMSTMPVMGHDGGVGRGSIHMNDSILHDGAVSGGFSSARHVPFTPESTLAPGSVSTPGMITSPQTVMQTPSSRSVPSSSSKGENAASMGDSTSLSFLHSLRQTFLHYMGPSPFTDKKRADAMLEAVMPQIRSCEVPEGTASRGLTFAEKKEYIERFHIATTGIIYICSPEEMLRMLEVREQYNDDETNTMPESQQMSQRNAVVDLVIAIGGQCCDTTPGSLRNGHKHFKRAQQVAFQGMLLNPSLDLICIFLLMSMYMLGACRRNGAFMYLGVAARSAHALGLHLPESYLHLAPLEYNIRCRLWKSLRVLDIAIGSVLSRPPATFPRGPHPDPVMAGSEQQSPQEFLSLSASFEVCTILEQILDHLGHKQDVNLASIEEFLARLRDWSESLPQSVRSSCVSWSMPPEGRRQALGNLAVSCFYYLAVILITRPVLVSYLLTKLKVLDAPSDVTASPRARPPQAEQIAQVCIDAAILVSETTSRAHNAGLLVQNMCLLKAWLFSASLVLGFSIFVDATCPTTAGTNPDAENALHGSINVIKSLAKTSPQAHHYLDVLTELMAAIKKHRERSAPPRSRGMGQYLRQIFVLNQDQVVAPAGTDVLATPMTSTQPSSAAVSGIIGTTNGPAESDAHAGLWILQQAAEASGHVNDPYRSSNRGSDFGEMGNGPIPMGTFDLDWGPISLGVTESSFFELDPVVSLWDTF